MPLLERIAEPLDDLTEDSISIDVPAENTQQEDAGVKKSAVWRKWDDLKSDAQNLALERYQGGESARILAAELGVSRGQIYRAIKKTKGPRNPKASEQDRQKVRDLFREYITGEDGVSKADVIRRIAEETGRSCGIIHFWMERPMGKEEISELLKVFDEYFPNALCREEAVLHVAKIFGKTVNMVRKYIDAHRKKKEPERSPLHRKIKIFLPKDSPEYFETKEAERKFLGSEPEDLFPESKSSNRNHENPYIADLYKYAHLLTNEEEQFLFWKLNYLKFRASTTRERYFSQRKTSRKLLEELKFFLEAADEVCARITQANTRLIVSVAKKFARNKQEFDELVSDGNFIMHERIVDCFDPGRGFRFSTYATLCLQRAFVPSRRKTKKQQYNDDMLRPGDMNHFASRRDISIGDDGQNREQSRILEDLLSELPKRSQEIIRRRFGLAKDGGYYDPEILLDIGKSLGISKERVRQIEAKALKKLRELTEKRGIVFQLS